jgi:hypothetical protein
MSQSRRERPAGGRLFGSALLVCLAAGSAPARTESVGDRMFDRLQSLAGDWEGTLEWSGARSGSGTLRASYRVVSNGSAVIESLSMGGDAPSMTTVYHRNGDELRMTHFCAARNQPRLIADRFEEPESRVHFSLVDVTNAEPGRGYVEAFDLAFLGDDRVELRFTFGGGAPQAVERILLRRSAAAPSPEDDPHRPER